MNFKNKAIATLTATILAIGLAPSVALAQGGSSEDEGITIVGPTTDQYDPIIERETGDGFTPDSSVGSLPFTGLDVVAMLAVALAVTGLGLALQRAVSREPRDLQ